MHVKCAICGSRLTMEKAYGESPCCSDRCLWTLAHRKGWKRMKKDIENRNRASADALP